MDYCTVSDVLDVAIDLRGDVVGYTDPSGTVRTSNTASIAQSEIEAIIVEATADTRSLLSPRYSIAIIEAFDPLPSDVVSYCKIVSAIIMYERYSSVDAERTQKQIDLLQKRVNRLRDTVVRGALRDNDGNLIAYAHGTTLQQGKDSDEFTAMDDLYDLYDTPTGQRDY